MRRRGVLVGLMLVFAVPGLSGAVSSQQVGPVCFDATGTADCGEVALSGTGDAHGDLVAVTATGNASCEEYVRPHPSSLPVPGLYSCLAVSGTGGASCEGRPCVGAEVEDAVVPEQVPPGLPGDQRVDNHEFRNWTDGDPDLWSVHRGEVRRVVDPLKGSADTDGVRAALEFPDGEHSAGMSQTSPRGWVGEDDPFVPGQSYDLHVMTRVEGTTEVRYEDLWLVAGVIWTDANANGRVLDTDFMFVEPSSAYDWYYSRSDSRNEFQTPLGATHARVLIAMLRSTTDAFDDTSWRVDDIHLVHEESIPRTHGDPERYADDHAKGFLESYSPVGYPDIPP